KKHDLVPHDETAEFVARSQRVWQSNQDAGRGWRPRAYSGPLDVFRDPANHRPPTVDWPATVTRRVHEGPPDPDGTHARVLSHADPDGTQVRVLADGLRPLIVQHAV